HITTAGHWNALARVLIHATSPGVPDTYQGDELWFFALVDPDNRRPVDYERRDQLLSAVTGAGALRGLHPSDERVKVGMVQRLLNIRRDHAAFFTRGRYTPLEVRGTHAEHVVAFARSVDDAQAIVVAPRVIQGLLVDNGRLPNWADTELVLPQTLQRNSYRLVLEDRELAIPRVSSALALSQVLTELPLTLLLSS
ncbi:MAG TPA: hypothetical protein VJW73_01035, partial [Gemmatimonadaceae bacterium]|nr:hypothetical protein [Gemmatimonadaceae bacterium]